MGGLERATSMEGAEVCMGIDVAIIAAYLAVTIALGLWYSGVKNVGDYFLGGRNVHWALASLSIVATETSALTVISVPGIAYMSGMGFLQVAFGYLAGRIFVSYLLLPRYFQGRLETVYQFLERSLGASSKKAVSALFHVTRVLADGVRLFATALPLTVMTGWDYRVSIAIIAAATLAYTFYGGIRSVIITDAVQLFLYLGGTAAALWYLFHTMDAPAFDIVRGIPPALLKVFHTGTELGSDGIFRSYNIVSGLLGGAFLSFASHGTDHLIVQRVLACRDLPSARRAMVTSGVVVIFQFALFLFLGLIIREYMKGVEWARSDEVIPYFIVRVLPPGLRGVLLAGIFAAAMSSLSSTINSLSSSTCMDLAEIDRRAGMTERKKLFVSRSASLAWTAVLAAVAVVFNYTTGALVETGLSIASVTYGGMMGIFVMGRLFPGLDDRAALAGMGTGIVVTALIAVFTQLFWLWFVALGFAVSFAAGAAANRLLGGGAIR